MSKAASFQITDTTATSPANSRFARKNAATIAGVLTGLRAGRRRSAIAIGTSRNSACPAIIAASQAQYPYDEKTSRTSASVDGFFAHAAKAIRATGVVSSSNVKV